MLVVRFLGSGLPQLVLCDGRGKVVRSLPAVVDVSPADCFHHEPNKITQAVIKTKTKQVAIKISFGVLRG